MNAKKCIAAVLATLMAISLVACGAKEEEAPEEYIPDYSKGLANDGYFQGVNISECVTLPENYLHLEVPASEVKLAEGEWDAYYNQLLIEIGQKNAFEEDKIIEEGDTVSIDFKGTIEDVPFEGGALENAEFVVGSQTYLPEIEEGVKGHKEGDSFNIPITFPEGYPSTTDAEGNKIELAGKTADFAVEINSIFNRELPDEVIAEEFKDTPALDGSAITSLEQLKENFQKQVETENLKAYLNDQLSQQVEIPEIPQSILDNFISLELEMVEHNAKSVGFETAEEFLKQNGFDNTEAYKDYLRDIADEMLRPQMALLAVSQDNDLSVDKTICENAFGSSYDELVEKFGKGFTHQNILMFQALDLLAKGAVIVDDATAESEVSIPASDEKTDDMNEEASSAQSESSETNQLSENETEENSTVDSGSST